MNVGRRIMSRAQAVGAGVMLSLLVSGTAACSRRAPESRVISVEARIDGITCATCVPPLEASLKRQYGTSAIEVDDEKDTATIRFAARESFSAADFRAAVERVRMRVVTVRLQACGRVDDSAGQRWLTAGANRFLLRSERDVPVNQAVCADGTLDSRSDPAIFLVSSFSVQRASGS
jgi:copper chaperone CopZ